MPNDIRGYYLEEFRNDFKRISFVPGTNATNPGDSFFDAESWRRAVGLFDDEQTKTWFIFSMFITVASDQIMFTYYPQDYRRFRDLTRYPKFGWCGLGPHNQNPLLLIQVPLQDHVVSDRYIEENSVSAAKLFVDEVVDFFSRHMPHINSQEFFEHFLNDGQVKDTLNNFPIVSAFLHEIEANVRAI